MNGEFAWMKLAMNLGLANSVEDIDRNIESALKREYIKFADLMDSESGAVSVVGSGPSLKKTWKKLRDSKTDIMSCNASLRFLLERGVTPKYFFCFDADPLMLEFIIPHPDITYLLASRCPPQTFDILKGCRIVLWHAAGDPNIESILEKNNKNEAMVIGGSAAVTRCIMLGKALGYTEINMYGADASFDGTDTHIQKSTTKEKRVLVMLNNRVFETAPWMASQVEDFKTLAPILKDSYGTRLIVHGDGLISHLARTMGFEVGSAEPKYKYVLRNAKAKARLFWQAL